MFSINVPAHLFLTTPPDFYFFCSFEALLEMGVLSGVNGKQDKCLLETSFNTRIYGTTNTAKGQWMAR